MSKKLLEESTIRSFMKLANLQPLTDKFLKESEVLEEKAAEEDEEEDEDEDEEEEDEEDEKEDEDEEKDESQLDEAHVVFGHDEDAKSRDVPSDRQNPTSGGGGGHKKAPKKTKVPKPGKMDAAKNAPGDAKLKPMKQTHVHSDKPDSIEHTKKSNAPKKNNSTFEVVSESLEEEMEDEAAPPESPDMGAESPEGGEEMGSAGEAGDHKEKMKGLIRNMLDTLKDMGSEYGMSMEISDEGAASPEGGEEMAPPEAPEGGEEDQEENEGMMQEKLDEMVEKLTKRVASRLVKESKKKR